MSSKQAYEREQKTFQKQLSKEQTILEKECWHLGNQLFSCESDAQKVIAALQKKHPFFLLQIKIDTAEKYASKGRPTKGAAKQELGIKAICSVLRNDNAISIALRRKGRFILATNILDDQQTPTLKILQEYKTQQSVEGGFRFLKDPWFMLDSFFLKKRERIAALMMVMTLCLFVYNFLQHRIRMNLKAKNETLPNQLGKQVQNPTSRWIFQIMEGVAVVKISSKTGDLLDLVITNLDAIRCQILRLLGPTICKIYGL